MAETVIHLSDHRTTHAVRPAAKAPGSESLEFDETTVRVAEVLMALESTRAIDFSLLAYVDVKDALGWVAVRQSGGKWRLTPPEASEVADAIRAERGFLGCDRVAEAFDRAAREARQLEADHSGQTLDAPVAIQIARKRTSAERLFAWTDRFTPGQRNLACMVLALLGAFAGSRVA